MLTDPGPTTPTDEVVEALARSATGDPGAQVRSWELRPLGHRVENLTTRSLDRLSGELADGRSWSAVAKTLRPASSSPGWEQIPDAFRAGVLRDLDWTEEPRIYRSGLSDGLPDGFRMPALYRIEETPGTCTLWMEDVVDHEGWDPARYHRTARALGRMSGCWPGEAAAAIGVGGRPIANLFHGKIRHLDLAVQADDRFWAEPGVAACVDRHHRRDLERLAADMPALLEELEHLPHGLAHGDATPDNLLEPGDGSIVAIDWSYGSMAPLGSDLGQLLAGRIESGSADPAELPTLAEATLEGYCDGLAESGQRVDRRSVERARATYLAVRSVFSALILDHRPDLSGDDRSALLHRRSGLARFGLDLVEQARSTA